MPRCYQCGNTNAFITGHDKSKLYCSECFYENLDDEISLGTLAHTAGHDITCAAQFHRTYNCICKYKTEKENTNA